MSVHRLKTLRLRFSRSRPAPSFSSLFPYDATPGPLTAGIDGPQQFQPDSSSRPRQQEEHSKDHLSAKLVPHDRFGDQEFGPFRVHPRPLKQATDPNLHADPPNTSRVRANTAPSDSLTPLSPIPNGGIGESPGPPYRSLVSPSRSKRSSFTTFFAFSSKRKPMHERPTVHIPQLQQDLLIPSHSVSGRWVSGSGQAQIHIIDPSSVPSPLQTDDDDYYYSYYTSPAPISSNSTSHPPNSTRISPSKQLSSRQQDFVGNPDPDSLHSSPVDPHSPHTRIYHPYAYSTPLPPACPRPSEVTPSLRHAASQPFHHHQGHRSGISTMIAHDRMLPSQPGHETFQSNPGRSQPQLKTSISTPNLASGAASVCPRSVIKKKPPKPKGQERWLSAETWWDALLSPSPRFKVKQARRPRMTTGRNLHDSMTKPVEEPSRNLGVTFPSVPAPRPRALSVTSVTSNVRPAHRILARSQSVVDLLGQSSTCTTLHPGFEPALETLVDEPAPAGNQVPGSDAEYPLPEPPLSLEQVIDEGEAFEQQRAQWKQQASKSLGNKRSRSFSRARSKSLGSRHAHGYHAPENSKAQFNLEFLAARTLLGSQSTMPTVHITKPSNSSSHSKAQSYSHSQSACSCSHTSHSRAYSHSHSHSLTTSNSSKSSRNLLQRAHSRNGSWSKPTFLKAGVLCGIGQDESCITSVDEKVPSSSRIDGQSTARMGDSTNAEGTSDIAKVSPSQSIPGSEVGLAITSTPPSGCFDLKVPGHPLVFGPRQQEGDQEVRWLSKYTHKSSEYAGPHLSAIDSNLPQLGVASGIGLRHRLPPRAAIQIAPIAHPYRCASAQAEQVGDKSNEGITLNDTIDQDATEPATERTLYPHLSLSHAEFEQYGVGEALVYASDPRPEEVLDAKPAHLENTSLLAAESLPSEEQSLAHETVALQPEEMDTSSVVVDSPSSLTNSTIQMVMFALDNPDDLDEFQDLFYKPHLASGDESQESSAAVNQVPTDVHGSATSSPLTHLVRKLSERVHGQRAPSRTPSDPTHLETSNPQDHRLDESGTKLVFTDLARSSSPAPMPSSSRMHVPIQKENPVLENLSEEIESETYGCPIRHGQFEAATTPSLIRTSVRLSTHLSIQEDMDVGDESAYLTPLTRRHRLSSVDAARSSYLTTSDVSQISALSDFPLPPSTQLSEQTSHTSILQAYFMPSPASQGHSQPEDDVDVGEWDRHADGGRDEALIGDLDETLRTLRTTSSVASFESRQSAFDGSDDMDFITRLHQARS